MEKKELVIDTARDLFTKYGFSRVTMDEIAIISGVTKKTIYTYFKDKESMLEYFIREELENMKMKIESIKRDDMKFIDFVSLSVYKMLLYRKESMLISSMIKDSRIRTSKLNSYLELYDREVIKYIEEIISGEVDANNIKKCDVHLMAFIIYKVYIALLFEYDKNIDEKEVTREITSILESGLLK